jgi:hypothetical protein
MRGLSALLDAGPGSAQHQPSTNELRITRAATTKKITPSTNHSRTRFSLDYSRVSGVGFMRLLGRTVIADALPGYPR